LRRLRQQRSNNLFFLQPLFTDTGKLEEALCRSLDVSVNFPVVAPLEGTLLPVLLLAIHVLHLDGPSAHARAFAVFFCCHPEDVGHRGLQIGSEQNGRHERGLPVVLLDAPPVDPVARICFRAL